MNDFDRDVCAGFCGRRQLERRDGQARERRRLRIDGDEQLQVDRTIVIVLSDFRKTCRVVVRGVCREMRVNRGGGVMLGVVIVQMRVHERGGEGIRLDRYRERNGRKPADHAPILCDPLDGVKQMSTARDADMIPAMRCFLCISRISLWVMVVLAAGCSGGQPQPSAPPPPTPAAAPAAAEGTAGHLYVTNERSGDLSIIDLATERVVATVPLGKRPRGIRPSPDNSLLYVALSGSPIAGPGVDESKLPPADKKADGIGIFDVKARKLLKILPGGSDPEQMAVSLDGKWLFVANEDVAQASVVDAADGKTLAMVKVGGEPEGVNLRPDGKVVYVTSEEDGEVFVIDAVKPRLITKFAVGPRPRSTAFLPDSSRAYVTSENSGSLSVVDAMKHRVISKIQLTGELIRPMGAVASSDGKLVFVSTGRGKRVVVIDAEKNEPVASIEVGDRPWGIAVSPDGKTVYTANGPSNDVSIVDVASRMVKTKIKVGDGPWGVALVP